MNERLNNGIKASTFGLFVLISLAVKFALITGAFFFLYKFNFNVFMAAGLFTLSQFKLKFEVTS